MGKSKGRVLLVSEYFLPHWTGISQAFFYLAQNLQDQGYDVVVLTTQFDKDLALEEKVKGVRVVRAPYQLKISRTHYSLALLARYIKLLPKYDWVIINSPNSNILFLSVVAKCFGKKLAIYHQGDLTLPRQTGNIIAHKMMEILFDALSIPSFLLANVTSTYTRDYAEHSRVMKYALRTFRAYIPSFKAAQGAADPTFVKKIATLKRKHILIGIAGRFVEEKGYDNLLEAMPQIKKSLPKAHIVFAGKHIMEYEPYFDHHKKLIEKNAKNITFLGLLDSGDLAHFYKNIDVFVISSRSDCFPVTQIEAAHNEVPIVVTNIPGARMLVKESGFGALAQSKNPSSLAKTIVATLKNRKMYLQNKKKALQFLHAYDVFHFD